MVLQLSQIGDLVVLLLILSNYHRQNCHLSIQYHFHFNVFILLQAIMILILPVIVVF